MSTAPPSRIPWPPIIAIGAIAIGVALAVVYPLPWIRRPASDMLFAVGCLCILGTVALYFGSIRALHRAKTTVLPTKVSEHLVTSGPYGFTRNPIYLGNVLLIIGVALVTGNAWLLPLALVAGALTSRLAITGEERHLDQRFSKKYRDYAKRVRRWL